jgi:hypothetical protein
VIEESNTRRRRRCLWRHCQHETTNLDQVHSTMAPAEPKERAVDPRPLTNVLIMGVGFFFVMGGYMPVQSFASSLLNFRCIPMGDISIGVVSA